MSGSASKALLDGLFCNYHMGVVALCLCGSVNSKPLRLGGRLLPFCERGAGEAVKAARRK